MLVALANGGGKMFTVSHIEGSLLNSKGKLKAVTKSEAGRTTRG